MLAQIGDTLNLTYGETVQLIAGALAAIGGLGAAYAAWKAARISALSVQEMRENRHQSIRPTFQVQGTRRIQVRLSSARVALIEDEVPQQEISPAKSYDWISAENIGLGVAQDLKAYFHWDGPPLRDVQLKKVQAFLSRNGISFGHGRLEEGKLTGPFILGYTQVDLPNACRPSETVPIRMTQWDLQALLVKVISRSLRSRKSDWDVFSEAGDLVLSYRSLSNEQRAQTIRVQVTGYLHILNGSLQGEWAEAHANLSFRAYDAAGIYPQPRSNLVRLLWLARGRRVRRLWGTDDEQWAPYHRRWQRRRHRRTTRGAVEHWWDHLNWRWLQRLR